jgi:N-acetylmuramoyl-L-alanine amidase
MQPIAPSEVARPDTPATSDELRGLNICIDPGHGAHNIGGRAFGVEEKVIALQVSLALRDKCQAAGAKVVMTRTTDVFIELDERCEIANRNRCDLFISIHANIAPNSSDVQGFEAFYHPNSRSGEAFARNLIASYDKMTDSPNRGAKERVLRVVDKTKMPAVLFELGFLSNREEGQRLASADYQKSMVQALFNGIVNTWAKKPAVSR